MYKVLIVDDEKMIRMGMKKVLPWQELKIEEVYHISQSTTSIILA